MKRLVILVIALVFAFCTTAMAIELPSSTTKGKATKAFKDVRKAEKAYTKKVRKAEKANAKEVRKAEKAAAKSRIISIGK
jgi:ABC-type transporter MlaC component